MASVVAIRAPSRASRSARAIASSFKLSRESSRATKKAVSAKTSRATNVLGEVAIDVRRAVAAPTRPAFAGETEQQRGAARRPGLAAAKGAAQLRNDATAIGHVDDLAFGRPLDPRAEIRLQRADPDG